MLEDLIKKLEIQKEAKFNEEETQELFNILLRYKELKYKTESQFELGFLKGHHEGVDSIQKKLDKTTKEINNVEVDTAIDSILVEYKEDNEVDIFKIITDNCEYYELDKDDVITCIVNNNNYLDKFRTIFEDQGFCIDLHREKSGLELF